MNLTPQKKLLKTVLDGRFDLFSHTNPAWIFDENLKEIFGLMYTAWTQKKLGKEGLLELIAQNRYREGKDFLFRSLILEIDKHETASNGILDVLKKNYQTYEHQKLTDDLQDQSLTESMRTDRIIQAAKSLSQASDGRTAILHKEAEKYSLSGGSDFALNSVDLHGDNMRGIFNGKIFAFVYTILGLPGMCKSRIGMSLAEDFYLQGKRVLFFSMEDNLERLTAKWIALRANIPFRNVLEGRLTETQKLLATELNKHSPHYGFIEVVDRRMAYQEWDREVRSALMAKKIDMILVDFVQAFKYNFKDEKQELREIYQGFANICNEYKVPIISLSQSNARKKDDGEVIEPSLGDGSGAAEIEQYSREFYGLGGKRDSPEKLIVNLKTTANGFSRKTIHFNELSGKILHVENEVGKK